jgi:Rod binding domain-containing protein
MEIPATIPSERDLRPNLACTIAGEAPSQADSAAKLKESCRQFEAILWRSVLEKSSLGQTDHQKDRGLESSDKTGTYQYFINDTIANAVSGLPSSFSSILFASLSPHIAQNSIRKDPS